ncbi:MAG TPA: cysteine desulfurase family protein [Acidimicrobiia bacterium]
MLYLDHAATTPMRPRVWEAMAPFASETFGNSSGIHEVSRRAKNALEEARETAADLIGAGPKEIVFTSGGTEADNLAVKGTALSGAGPSGIVVSSVEHEAVLESARFCARLGHLVAVAQVDDQGRVDPASVAELIEDSTVLVSVMAANNETGVIEPVREVVHAVRERMSSVTVHTDAVQAFISEDLDVSDLGVDLLSLAAHKFGGPKGIGLLFVREGTRLEPVAHGGGHELGRRSGTHNVMGAVGMAAAMTEAVKDRDRFRSDVGEARRRFESALTRVLPDLRINAPLDNRLVQHSHVRIPGVRNETVLIRLDRNGVAASSASACQSGANTVSHVLRAMGFSDEEARQCLRFTFGWTTRPDEGEEAARIVLDCLEGLL